MRTTPSAVIASVRLLTRISHAYRRTVFDFIHPADQQSAHDMLRSLCSDNTSDTAWDAPPRTLRVQKKDLTYVWVEMQICTDVRPRRLPTTALRFDPADGLPSCLN